MVELALLDQEGLFVSPYELTLSHPSFTVDSVEYFAKKHSEAEIHLLVGGDSFAHLTEWYRWREIVARAKLAILVRPGWEIERTRAELPAELTDLLADGRAQFVDNDPVEVSSTELREMLRREQVPPADVMPGLVVEYARKYSLYR